MVQATPEGGFRDQVPPGVRLIDLNAKRALTSVLPLARYLRRERPDAVVSGAIQTNIAAVWARKLAGVSTRLMLTEHNTITAIIDNARMFRTRISPYFIRKFYPWADEIVAVSQGAASDLASVMKVPVWNIPVIYNPIIGPDFWKRAREPMADREVWPEKRPIILAVGRMHFLKDYPTLLRAFAEVIRSMDAQLIFLGDGEERLNLTAMANELQITDHVSFLGQVPNVLPYMKRATVFVLSSIQEALPTVVIEALALGLPIVSTDCPSGPREILCDGAYGTLVPVGDSNALAQAILNSLRMPRKEPVPQVALQRFDHDTAVRKYLNLLGFREYVCQAISTPTKVEVKPD